MTFNREDEPSSKFLFMTEIMGWRYIEKNGHILWFKGYTFKITSDQLLNEFITLVNSESPSLESFSALIKGLNGHFSVVLEMKGFVFAAVDKVCSIPLYYVDDGVCKIIGNHPSQLIQEPGFIPTQSSNAALEIAMSGYTIGNKTLYQGLFQLTAGECLLLHGGVLERQFYYTYSPWKVRYSNQSDLMKEFSQCVLDSLHDVIVEAQGRRIVIPLSAGYDSRLVASGLHYLGAKNVFCFAYGLENSFESETSRAVAEQLGFPWMHVPLTSESQRNYFNSREFDDYKQACETLSSTPFVQDVSVFSWLKQKKVIPVDSVIVNGNTGDYISGGHILNSLKGPILEKTNSRTMIEGAWHDFFDKHFSLWGVLRGIDNDHYIQDTLYEVFEGRGVPDLAETTHLHGVFECLEYLGRQSKYIVNMQRSYEFHNYAWFMPLWSDSLLNFWEGVPVEYKIDQRLYKNTLIENNWGGVWHDMPVNRRTINPIWLRFFRLVTKVLCLPFGKNVWHHFDKKVFHYYLDETRNSVVVPYKKVLFDRRAQRHAVSWLTELYLKDQGFNIIKR